MKQTFSLFTVMLLALLSAMQAADEPTPRFFVR